MAWVLSGLSWLDIRLKQSEDDYPARKLGFYIAALFMIFPWLGCPSAAQAGSMSSSESDSVSYSAVIVPVSISLALLSLLTLPLGGCLA